MLKGWGLNLKKALNNVNILCGKMMVVFESILSNPTVMMDIRQPHVLVYNWEPKELNQDTLIKILKSRYRSIRLEKKYF